jgi:hypothetical protein
MHVPTSRTGAALKRISKHLTYANVMSTIAVFLLLGGATAFAASKINGSSIKAKSIAGGKLKNDTLTGTQIKESSLGQVPSAAKADSANTANSATKADSANTAGTATKADSANTATTATNAGNANTVGGKSATELSLPTYYGHFTTAGGVATLDPGETSASVVSILRTPTGNYCVNLTGQPKTVSATVDRFQGGKHIIHAEITNEADCELRLFIINPEGANGEGADGNAYFQAW